MERKIPDIVAAFYIQAVYCVFFAVPGPGCDSFFEAEIESIPGIKRIFAHAFIIGSVSVRVCESAEFAPKGFFYFLFGFGNFGYGGFRVYLR